VLKIGRPFNQVQNQEVEEWGEFNRKVGFEKLFVKFNAST